MSLIRLLLQVWLCKLNLKWNVIKWKPSERKSPLVCHFAILKFWNFDERKSFIILIISCFRMFLTPNKIKSLTSKSNYYAVDHWWKLKFCAYDTSECKALWSLPDPWSIESSARTKLANAISPLGNDQFCSKCILYKGKLCSVVPLLRHKAVVYHSQIWFWKFM